MVVSDWHGTYSTVEAVQAGLDLEMPGPAFVRGNALRRMVTCGKVSEADINARARNVSVHCTIVQLGIADGQVLQLVEKVKMRGIIGDGSEHVNSEPPIELLRRSAAVSIPAHLLLDSSNVVYARPADLTGCRCSAKK